METALNKTLNTQIINLIPSKTVKEHLLKENVIFGSMEQLKIINDSFINIEQKKELYLKYSLDDTYEIYTNACRMIGEIEKIKHIMENNENKYNYEVEENVYNTKEEIESNITEQEEYTKVNVIEKATDEVICIVWFNSSKEIILFELFHDLEDTGENEIPEEICLNIPLPFKIGDKVHLVKGLGDNEEYEVVKDMSNDNIIEGVITLLNTKYLKEKLSKDQLILNYEYYNPLIIE